MNFNKDDIYSLIGTLVFHLAIILLLLSMTLRTEIPDDDGGVLVNFGNVNAAAGTFEPRYTGEELPRETTTPPTPPAPPVKEPKTEMLTQDTEESIALAEAKKREKREKEKEEQRKKEEEEKRRREEEFRKRIEAEERRAEEERQKKEQAISNRVAGAFGIGTADGSSQGDAESGLDNQGSPFGNSDHGANEGIGGYGSFNLNGRSLGAGGLPRPAYTIQDEGKIVINITVNPKGNVIFAEIGRGTNIDNASMRKSALEAAGRAKFNSINEAANNQSGTITYVYKLK